MSDSGLDTETGLTPEIANALRNRKLTQLRKAKDTGQLSQEEYDKLAKKINGATNAYMAAASSMMREEDESATDTEQDHGCGEGSQEAGDADDGAGEGVPEDTAVDGGDDNLLHGEAEHSPVLD